MTSDVTAAGAPLEGERRHPLYDVELTLRRGTVHGVVGVRLDYQDLAVFPNLTVAENLALQGDRNLLSRVRVRRMRTKAVHALEQLGLRIGPSARLGALSIAERQLVAIARCVSSDGRIILMDEPTAAHPSRDRAAAGCDPRPQRAGTLLPVHLAQAA